MLLVLLSVNDLHYRMTRKVFQEAATPTKGSHYLFSGTLADFNEDFFTNDLFNKVYQQLLLKNFNLTIQ